MSFNLKDGGDMVCAVVTVPEEEFEAQLGLSTLGTADGYTTYLQLPTCGTLNREELRALWGELVEKAKEITLSFS